MLPKNCKIESSNELRNLSVVAFLPKNVIFLFVNANLPSSQQLKLNLLLTIRQLNFTSYPTLTALSTMKTACSLFLQKDVRHLIFPLFEDTFVKIFNPTYFLQTKKFVYNLKISRVFAVF